MRRALGQSLALGADGTLAFPQALDQGVALDADAVARTQA
jgi:hypothetical protein